MKIDPDNITNYNLNQEELEHVILFWVCAAGKNGHTSAKALDNFLNYWKKELKLSSPFEIIKKIINENFGLAHSLKEFGIGCFNCKSITFKELAFSSIDLKKCDISELERIKGIGNKTSRCFLIHSRPNQRLAGLDRHILYYLKELGISDVVNTPSGKKYREIEEKFLKLVDASGKTVSEFDLEIWKKYRKKNDERKVG